MFIQDRGPPYRKIDLFDQLIESQIGNNEFDTHSFELTETVKNLRDELLINEMPNWSRTRDLDQCLPVERVEETLSKDLASARAKPFPILSEASVSVFKEEETNKVSPERFQPQPAVSMRLSVPDEIAQIIHSDLNARRHLAVLEDFLRVVREESLAELRKKFSAVCRAMKSRFVRKQLCYHLARWAIDAESGEISESLNCLSNVQFEYLVRLAEVALTNSTGYDLNSTKIISLTLSKKILFTEQPLRLLGLDTLK